MYKKLIAYALLFASITACAPTYVRTKTSAKLSEPIKEVLVVIEKLSFSPRTYLKDGVLQVDPATKNALFLYEVGLYRTLDKDMVRIMADNGVSAKLVYAPIGSRPTTVDMKAFAPELQGKFQHILWISHNKGIFQCQYGGCKAFFQTNAKLFDATFNQVLWGVDQADSQHYNDQVWSDGRMYKLLLQSLGLDGVIDLPKGEPIVDMGSPTKR